MTTAGSILVEGNGSVKCVSQGFYKAVGPLVVPVNPANTTLRAVASIIDGTYNNPSNGGAWSDPDPIEMETSVYKYEIDGSDPSVVDSTDSSVTNRLFVMMKPITGDTFFGSTGDKLQLSLTKWNFGTGRLRVRFAKSSISVASVGSDHSNMFGTLVLNGRSTNGNGPNGTMKWSRLNSSGSSTTTDEVAFSTDIRNALDDLALSTPGDPVILSLERTSDNEIKASVLDSQGSETTLTCNTSSAIDTNTSNVKVADVTHLVIEEASSSQIDLIVEKVQ